MAPGDSAANTGGERSLLFEPPMSQVPSAEQMLSPGFSLLSVGAEDFTAIEGAVVELIKYVVALAVDGGGHREEGSADNVLSRIDVDEVVLQRFTRKIGTMYRHTPYHNFWHALCVSRECALIVKALHEWAQLESLRPTPPSLAPEHALSPGTDAVPPAPFFTARELFTIMVSALVHDVDHPGTNNDFEIKSRSKLAVLYNDNSVLENHHVSLTFSVLQAPDLDIYSRWNADDVSEARKLITNAVLNTDMALHKSLMLDLLGRAENPPAYDLSQPSARHELVKIILHTADIFNPARSSDVSAAVSRQVCTEFLAQAAMEKAAALPVTPWMSDLDNELSICKGELGFARFVARPYFAALAACFMGNAGLNFVPQIDENVAFWEAEIARLEVAGEAC